ncbi:hypothetical protein DUNSADRAFT_17046 [Dunaliella salina]|uniref:Uncharacterized protein n=1 Tax=Dunaliella salina TaxID=3046 RepID=A0ABQ7H0H1_DUNSA|nr:hypothetical protein DUNSADRAFT_17046 [Dunaliella salina]|eukprot:KAF5840349.1 hypothetical protein DUNSADRAFT_17046 [Dunaliella salina]
MLHMTFFYVCIVNIIFYLLISRLRHQSARQNELALLCSQGHAAVRPEQGEGGNGCVCVCVEVRYVCWVNATRRALYNALPCWAVALAACAGMRQAMLHIGGSLNAMASAVLLDTKATQGGMGGDVGWVQEDPLFAGTNGMSASDVVDKRTSVGAQGAWAGVGAEGVAGFVGGGDGGHESVLGSIAPYVLVLLAMVPWTLALLLVRVLPGSQAHALVWSEPTGVAFMIWFAAVRALMAAGMLHVASTRFWLTPGSSLLMALEDMMQILLPVRTPQAALPCCLNALSTAALHIHLGTCSGPGAAFVRAMLWGCVCLLGFFVLDLWSRRAFFCACRTQAAVCPASAQHAKR